MTNEPVDTPATVSLTFDVDAEAGLGVAQHEASLSTRSERRYGITRGLPRILELLERAGIKATFYVPGVTALRHPEAIQEVAREGHEIAHHGHSHRLNKDETAAAQRSEIEEGLVALQSVAGVKPDGYRSPAWELTATTLALLVEHGFKYDSSCMGDDRAYVEAHGELRLVELPVHWSLDDWIFFRDGEDTTGAPAESWRAVWESEFRQASHEGRHVTYTMHPEIIGRGYRFRAFEELIGTLQDAGAGFMTHRQLADSYLASLPREPFAQLRGDQVHKGSEAAGRLAGGG